MRIVKDRVRLLLLIAGAITTSLAAPKSQDPVTDLLNAVRDADPSRVASAVARGASPDSKDAEGTPAIMLAALYSNARTMETLLSLGADPNATNAAHATALHWSAGDPAKARMLILKGADVNARSGPGRTPLGIAAAQDNNFEIVKLMVDRGADVNAADQLEGFLFTGGGRATPLIEAAKTRDLRTVKFLLDHGARVNAEDHMGATALTEASLRGSADIVRLLLQHGADPNHAVKQFAATPLIFAAMRGSEPVLDLLISKGASVEARDATGSTALMWAVYSDNAGPAAAARLIAAGADVNAKNKLGESPMTWAARRGETAMVALLRKAGVTSETPASAVVTPTAFDQTPGIRDAVSRSLALLEKTGPQAFKASGCATCHNQTLPMMAADLARKQGIQPDEQLENQQMKSMLAFLKPTTEIVAEFSDVFPDIPVSGGYIALALAARNYPADAATAALVHNIAGRQLKDGSWIGWAPRPPLESGDIQATALAIRVIQLYGPAGRKAEFAERIARARHWLRKAVPVTTEEKAMPLFGLAWSNASSEDIRSATRTLLQEQRQDGGWAQLPTLASDAYATGKVLVALHEAANVSAGAPVYRDGVNFLLRTQDRDGSWLVKTRSFPFQPLKDTGFPHGRDQWISAAGTSWAVMALSYAVEPLQIANR
jgi:ankyrin repeat protein